MSNQPPPSGAPGPDGSPDEPTRHPSGDRSPYGPPSGPPAQANPYGEQPPNPYGQPAQNPYAQPPPSPYAQPPQSMPPYGQPQQNPYGQPPQNPYAQPGQANPYGQPQSYPQGAPQPPQHGRGSGGGRKKWLIPVLAVVVLAVAGGGVLAAVLLSGDDSSGTSVADLSGGDCLTSSDIADGEADIDDITTSSCSEAHDAEVFATYELGSDEVEEFDIDAAGTTCVDELESAGTSLDDLTSEGHEVRPLVANDDPSEGDAVVCFIRNSDGDQLSEQIVE